MCEGMCVAYYSSRYICFSYYKKKFSLSVPQLRNIKLLYYLATWFTGGLENVFLKGEVVAYCDVMKAATTAASSPAASE
jgi:hypothetical protein